MCEETKREDKKKDSEDVKSDAQEGDYYYDDAHGYEIYKPETDEETDEN